MSVETYRRPVMHMGRMCYALKSGHGLYAARSAGALLGVSLGMALLVAAGAALIVGAVSLVAAGKKSTE